MEELDPRLMIVEFRFSTRKAQSQFQERGIRDSSAPRAWKVEKDLYAIATANFDETIMIAVGEPYPRWSRDPREQWKKHSGSILGQAPTIDTGKSEVRIAA